MPNDQNKSGAGGKRTANVGRDAFQSLACASAARERARLASAIHDGPLQVLLVMRQDCLEAAEDGGSPAMELLARRLLDVSDGLRAVTRPQIMDGQTDDG